jgi:WhiB family redox-sensing transcriptional regulator
MTAPIPDVEGPPPAAQVSEGLGWMARGECVGQDPDLFFPDNAADQSIAVSICRQCPVIAPCLDHGLRHEQFGIWGGTGQRARARMRRERGIRLEPAEHGGPNRIRRP